MKPAPQPIRKIVPLYEDRMARSMVDEAEKTDLFTV